MFDFVAKRVEAGVPVWGLFEGGSEVGVLTDFDGEGVVATIETRLGEEYTFRGGVIADVLSDCRKAYVADYEYAEAELRDLDDAEKKAAEIVDNFWVSQEQEDYDHDRDMQGWDFANGVRA